MKKRIFSMIIAVCMVFTLLPSAAFATEGNGIISGNTISGTSSVTDKGNGGEADREGSLGDSGKAVCEEHKEHDDDCGYIEAVAGEDCSHLTEDGAYSCAPVLGSGVNGNATPSDADKDYVCNHSDDCSYIEEIPGVGCSHECELCEQAEKPVLQKSTQTAISGTTSSSEAWNDDEAVVADGVLIYAAAKDVVITVNGTVTVNGLIKVRRDGSNTVIFQGTGTLKRGAEYKGPLLEISSGNAAVLDGITADGDMVVVDDKPLVKVAGALTMKAGSKVTGSNGGNGVLVTGSNASFTMEGGEISGNESRSGAGVSVTDSGTFTMSGDASIKDNTATGSGEGGGVLVGSGTFTMSGGTIEGNTAYNGGGVRTGSNANFTMSGGTIRGNTAPYGGGVYMGAGTFTMSGGTITENSVTDGEYNTGGGICVAGPGTFTISGGAIVTGNTKGDLPNNVNLGKDRSGNDKTITVAGELTGSIGVTTDVAPTEETPVSVAVGKTGTPSYAMTADDAAKITGDSYLTYFDSATGTVKLKQAAASIGGSGYPTLQAAVTVVQNGETITLLKDVTERVSIAQGSTVSFTLDLNGKTLASDGETIRHNGTGTLTIEDKGTGGKIKSTKTDFGGVIALIRGSLIVKSGTVEITDVDSYCSAIYTNPDANITITILGGTLRNSGINLAVYVQEAKLIISGGEIIGSVRSLARRSDAVTVKDIPAGKKAIVRGNAARPAINIIDSADIAANGIAIKGHKTDANGSGSLEENLTLTAANVADYKYLEFAPAAGDTPNGTKITTALDFVTNGADSDCTTYAGIRHTHWENADKCFTWASNTLTLNNLNLETPNKEAIRLPSAPTEVVTTGVSTVQSTYSGTGQTVGILCGSTLTLSGTGTLNAIGGESTSTSCGVISFGDSLTISGGTLNATGGATTYESFGVYSLTAIVVSGGTLEAKTTATSGTILQAMNHTPITSGYTNAKITASTTANGTMDTYDASQLANYKHIKIEPDTKITTSLDFSNVTANVNCTAAADATPAGSGHTHADGSKCWEWVYDAQGCTLKLNNVDIEVNEMTGTSAGIDLPAIETTILFSGTNQVITGDILVDAINSQSGSITLTGADDNAVLNASGRNRGIGAANKTLTITRGTVNAVGRKTDGIRGRFGVTISGGKVTATTNSTSENSAAIAVSGGDITLSGGTVTAQAGAGAKPFIKVPVLNGMIHDSTTGTWDNTTGVACTYKAFTDTDAVAAAKSAIVDGTVNVAGGADQAAKTAAVQSYVNSLLTSVSAAAGVTATVSYTGGSSYSVAIAKGSANETKSITMTITELPVDTHAVIYTLNNITATPNPASVTDGGTLDTTLTAASGYTLPDTITVTMGGTTLTAGTGYTYTKASGAVAVSNVTGNIVITASGVAENVAVTGITLNKNTLALYSNSTPNSETLIATVAPANAYNKAVTWSSSNTSAATVANGVVTAVSNGTATITAASAADGTKIAVCTVTVSTYSGDGSSSDDSNITVTPPAQDKPNTPTQGEIKLEGKVEGGNATISITDKNITDAFDKALADAKKKGNESNGITLVLSVDTGGTTVNTVTVNLPKTVQDTIISKKIVNTVVVVNQPDIVIGMDLATVTEINKQANADVNISATRMGSSTLTGNAITAIGSRPVFDLGISTTGGKAVESFGAGSVSVSIPYILGANEKAGNVQAVYLDGTGEVQWLTSSVYDSANKVLRFRTNHFSTYGVGYRADAPALTDIDSHWAKDDIQFVVNRGLLAETGAATFSPNTAMTRGMFVTALGRLANANVSGYKQSSFPDVKADAYYMGYIEWASKNGIVSGGSDGKFSPEAPITREQMAAIMSNYAKAIGYTTPKVHAENDFADSAKISAYAKDAVKQMQMAGVLAGKSGNAFDPQGKATRAEVSAVLRRFVELAISSDTMQGFTMNDSGQWMYYQDGKPVTGKKDIDGASYTFDRYGVTADVPNNLKYTTDVY